ncbi:MAG: DnaJ domain-containing protein [Deltaproteobacteria bacterium]|nr:DnaJ domain-containing protein [Deltaproteobacteria bacterium]
MKRKDYYQTLGVSKGVEDDELKKAFRAKAKQYHPDLHPGNKKAEANFKEVNEAYGVLSDKKKRQQYDLGGADFFDQSRGGGRADPRSSGGGYSGSGGFSDMGGMDDIFSEIFGSMGGRTRRQPQKGSDLEYSLKVDFLHAIKGTEINVTVKRGTGTEKITVRIPPGISDGSKVRVVGKGGVGINGGPSGDLYIVTKVMAHEFFYRKRDDIYVDVPVTVGEAALGGNIRVPTIEGFTTIKVPAGTKSGQKLRIKGKGVPGVKLKRKPGDLYVVLNISLPKKLSSKAKKLITELEAINGYEPRSGLW